MRAFLLLAWLSSAIGNDPILELGTVGIVGKASSLEIGPSSGASVLTVMHNGNVGIGVDSPITPLQVGSLDGAYAKARIAIASDGARLDIGHWDGANSRIESGGKPLYLTSYGGDITLHKQAGSLLKVGTDGVSVTGSLVASGSVAARDFGTEIVNVWVKPGETLCQRAADQSLKGCYHPTGVASSSSYLNFNGFAGNARLGHIFAEIDDGKVVAYCVLVQAHAQGWNEYTRVAFRGSDSMTGRGVSIDKCGENNADMRLTNSGTVDAHVRIRQMSAFASS